MKVLGLISSVFIDFLFPKSIQAQRLETFTASWMIEKFPSPREIKEVDIISIFDYRNTDVKNFIWEIKYRGNKKLAKVSAEIIYEILCQEIAERALSENFKNPLLLPIPISINKYRERGYNQIELICEEISALDNHNLLTYRKDILKKIKHTESQSHTHNKKERMENLKNSMLAETELKPRDHSVVLIDDVFTTGATITEAKRALRQAGFRKILALTLAH